MSEHDDMLDAITERVRQIVANLERREADGEDLPDWQTLMVATRDLHNVAWGKFNELRDRVTS